MLSWSRCVCFPLALLSNSRARYKDYSRINERVQPSATLVLERRATGYVKSSFESHLLGSSFWAFFDALLASL